MVIVMVAVIVTVLGAINAKTVDEITKQAQVSKTVKAQTYNAQYSVRTDITRQRPTLTVFYHYRTSCETHLV